MIRLRRSSALIASLALAGIVSFTPTGAVAAGPSHANRIADDGSQAVPPDGRVLAIKWEQEKRPWWCGPAAARMALKSWVANPMSQSGLADLMVTLEGPLPWDWATANVGHASDGMNEALRNSGFPRDSYVPASFTDGADDEEKAQSLREDAQRSIGRFGHAMVVNVASMPDSKLHPAYPDRAVYHYITIYGYDQEGDRLYVADPASGMNDDYADVPQKYTITSDHLANIMHDGDDSDQYYTADLFGGR